ncbi:MAG: OprO/OprP family phosphate-selective porin, partial [Phycisphaerales bacterium]|nr:OprO/OprP family phosphate-selective porin [Phycisphaerales bacterium]
MSRNKFLVMLAGAALGFGATGALAQSDSERAYSAELSADAVAKTQSFAKANGFTITDGTNKLRVSGFTQFRYNLNWRDDPGNDGNGDHDSGFANGFELPRTRMILSGNVLDPNLSFKVEGQFSDDSDGSFDLLDAFAAYKYNDEFTVAGGQFQVPLMREWYLSPFGVQGADYGMVTDVFNPGYSQGIWGVYQNDAFKGIFAFDDGGNAANTRYNSVSEADYGLTARLEGKLSGDWARFNDMSSWKSDNGVATLIGGGIHYQNNGNTAHPGNGPAPQFQYLLYTIDASIEFAGANLYGAFVGQHIDPSDEAGGDSYDDFGVQLAGGFFLAEQDELFGRWDWIIADDDRPTEDEDVNALTVGWNHYFVP